jgi:hypothetical protein
MPSAKEWSPEICPVSSRLPYGKGPRAVLNAVQLVCADAITDNVRTRNNALNFFEHLVREFEGLEGSEVVPDHTPI